MNEPNIIAMASDKIRSPDDLEATQLITKIECWEDRKVLLYKGAVSGCVFCQQKGKKKDTNQKEKKVS
jgi:hypothetical protein